MTAEVSFLITPESQTLMHWLKPTHHTISSKVVEWKDTELFILRQRLLPEIILKIYESKNLIYHYDYRERAVRGDSTNKNIAIFLRVLHGNLKGWKRKLCPHVPVDIIPPTGILAASGIYRRLR